MHLLTLSLLLLLRIYVLLQVLTKPTPNAAETKSVIQRPNIFTTLTSLVRQEGWKGLFRGVKVRAIYVSIMLKFKYPFLEG